LRVGEDFGEVAGSGLKMKRRGRRGWGVRSPDPRRGHKRVEFSNKSYFNESIVIFAHLFYDIFLTWL
jgi:hypothetical protein